MSTRSGPSDPAGTATSREAVRPGSPKRPGGRSARVQSAVYTAVGRLVGLGERETMTIPRVAELAGVNPTSIYRRWGTIAALLEEVAVAALTRGEPLPDTGDIQSDLAAWARIIADDVDRPSRRDYLKAMVSSRDGLVESCPCWETRSAQATDMVERAAARGETPPTAAAILEHVIAPLYHHAVFGLRIDDDYAARLCADTMAIARASHTAR